MEYRLSGDQLAIRLDPGDDLMPSIGKAVTDSGMGSGFVVSCIGALSKARLTAMVTTINGMVYAPIRELTGALEMVVASGNIEPKVDGGVKVHLHGFLDVEFRELVGGHFDDTGNIIGITAEILVQKFPGMTRASVQTGVPKLIL
jgi:predicted DNA-binding protein with PD1-like motif